MRSTRNSEIHSTIGYDVIELPNWHCDDKIMRRRTVVNALANGDLAGGSREPTAAIRPHQLGGSPVRASST